MIGATADTNIYISGLLFGGLPEQFLRSAAAGRFRLDISEKILSEVLRVLKEKFSWGSEQLRNTEVDIRLYTSLVVPLQSLDVIKSDPSDNRILECAVGGKSDFIVSGDARHVLGLGSYSGIQIIKVADFIALLGADVP